ncbi:MAG TPA: hypothetical protein PK765_04960 [bacterium]|nr:hypothetical protein [bacterium]
MLDTLSDTAGTLWQENPDAIALPKPKNGTGSIRQPGWAEERPILAWILLPLWLATIFLPDTKRHG